jgi:hypothetical protein
VKNPTGKHERSVGIFSSGFVLRGSCAKKTKITYRKIKWFWKLLPLKSFLKKLF